jgi:hypothetical protein
MTVRALIANKVYLCCGFDCHKLVDLREDEMGTATLVWLVMLSLGLIAHMIKDATEFKKIEKLQKEIERLTQK